MKKNILNFLSFLTFALVAVLIFVKDLLPHVGITVTGSLFSIFETIKDVLFLLIIGIMAYKFVSTKSKVWKIIFIVMLIIFIVGLVLRLV